MDRPKLKVLDLFSGIGGFSLGLERTGGFETVAFCEIEDFPRRVLKKHWPHVPCYEDIRNVTAERLTADGIAVDVITGGFPCQDISTAGNQAGINEGTRSGLWSEIARLTSELRPQYVIVENVANLLSGPSERRGGWFGRILGDLAECGYDAEWCCIPASDVGAPHERTRVWVVAYPSEKRFQGSIFEMCGLRGGERSSSTKFGNRNIPCGPGWGELGAYLRVGDGLSRWSHEIGGLGNAVVPQIPEIIGRAILEAEHANA